MLSLNPSGFACSFNEKNIQNLTREKGGRNEFSASRSRRAKFYNVVTCLHYFNPIRTFWTFTIPELQKDYKNSDRFYSKQFSKLLEGLSRRYKRGAVNGLKNYVWVSEAQKRGNIHFHLVTSTPFLDVQYVNYYWARLIGSDSKNCVDVEYIKESEIRNISGYFAKYMSKGHTGEMDDLKGRVIYARSFGYSKNFPIVEKISINPIKLLTFFPDMQDKVISKEIEAGVFVDYYFFDSKTVLEIIKKEAEKKKEIEEFLLSGG